MEVNEQQYAALLERLAARMTPDFLALLKDCVEVCGWSVDFYESARFVEWCYETASAPKPDLNFVELIANEGE